VYHRQLHFHLSHAHFVVLHLFLVEEKELHGEESEESDGRVE